MISVTVGGFHDHIVGIVYKGGVANDGLSLVAQVAGKDDLFGNAIFCGPDFQNRGAKQVACVAETDLDPFTEVEKPAVLHGFQHLDRLLGIHQGVQRLHRRQTGPLALLVVPVGVPLLDMSGVPEHDTHQLGG